MSVPTGAFPASVSGAFRFRFSTCKDCGKPLVNEQTIKAVADLFREKGSNAWFDMTAEEILPAGTKCECGCASFDKETDTMDVWFDSGSSWRAVIENREGQN